MPRTALITPVCCQAIEESHIVFLLYDFADFKDGSYREKEPHWAAYCLNPETGRFEANEVKHCPHCGTALPDLQKRHLNKKTKVCSIAKDCKTCETCSKPLHGGCQCWPPEYVFEPAEKYHPRNRMGEN